MTPEEIRTRKIIIFLQTSIIEIFKKNSGRAERNPKNLHPPVLCRLEHRSDIIDCFHCLRAVRNE